MRAYQIVPIIVIALAPPASAQQSDQSLRHQIESVVSSYAENFNKQNASGIAGLCTKDGVLVTFRRKIDVSGIEVSWLPQNKARRGERQGPTWLDCWASST